MPERQPQTRVFVDGSENHVTLRRVLFSEVKCGQRFFEEDWDDQFKLKLSECRKASATTAHTTYTLPYGVACFRAEEVVWVEDDFETRSAASS